MRRSQILRLCLALAAEILCLAALNWFDDWTLEEMPVKFVTLALLSGIAALFALTEFHTLANRRAQVLIFWGMAVILRVAAISLEPGDDFWRYQWEGKIQRAGFNPYVQTPDDSRLDLVRAQFPQWHRINHRDFHAVYPPGAELVFAGLSGISDQPLLYKIVFAAADLGTVGVLLLLFPKSSRYADAAWYAWNPLVVYSFAGAAHFDSLMILPMTAGILFLVRVEGETNSGRKWLFALAAAVAFGIAISIKLVPALLLLSCVFALGFRAIALLLSLGIPALLGTFYGWPGIPVWESLGRFAHVTRLNDLFWWLIEETVWPNPHQKNYHYDVILIMGVILVSLWFWRNWKRGMIWALGIALVLSPVLHPWCCAWVLPLAAWRRAYAWFVLSVTLFIYFLFWNERLFALPWHSEPWMRALILVPPSGALLLGLSRKTPGKVSS